jgi:hypothetical protein
VYRRPCSMHVQTGVLGCEVAGCCVMNLPVRASYSAESPGLGLEADVSRFYIRLPYVFFH